MGNSQDGTTNDANKSAKLNAAPTIHKNITHIAGFPNMILPRENHPAQIYSRTLFASGNGYPMWLGSTTSLPEPYKRRATCIGDVGYLNNIGTFTFAFNIFLPSDDPLNRASQRRLPAGYVPLEPPRESEIQKISGYFAPGSVILSKGVDVARLSEAPLHLTFNSSESEAAFLILPEGASREDMSISRIDEYLKKHALSWIQHFHYHSDNGYATPNGGIYIITGCDKTKSYSTAAFPKRNVKGSREMSAQYVDGKLRYNSSSTASRASTDWRDPFEENCIFFRGIRLALKDTEWNLQFDELPPSLTPISVLGHTPPISDQLIPVKRDSEEVQAHTDIINDESNNKYSDDSSEHRTVRVLNYPFHPSDIILQIMLSECPGAQLAFVNDYVWSECSEKNKKGRYRDSIKAPLTSRCIQGSFISDFGAMLDAIFQTHKIVEADGVLSLVPNSKKKFFLISWVRGLRNRLRSKPPQEPAWGAELISDLVRQGEAMKDRGEKFHISY
ncbi:hypothetical protein CVT25_002612 [Psilocybe cyanescens]|uniref:Uncharacterized protein n=1 Tax=Psilocybe cyanescens TaxID=93625 RepID=A0A409WLS9_PSICY|nr:hypothetical protein CVT25_002612 [Psilocybe cyanescens]